MSVAAYSWAAEQVCGSPLAKLLLLTMADWGNMDWRCDAPTDKLVRFVEAAEEDVIAALGALRDAEIIVWDGVTAVLPAPPDHLHPSLSPKRKRIYERDGYACVYCGATERLTLDHKFPKSRGGSNLDSNLATACHSCNSTKGARTPEEWRR